jgi:glycosyltransferase 2 family protein
MMILFKLSVSSGLIWFLISKIDSTSIIDLLTNADLILLFWAFTFSCTQILVLSLRWKIILEHQNINIPFISAMQVTWVGLFVSQTMPSTVGGDLFRLYYLVKNQVTKGKALLAVLMDRIFGILGLVLLTFFSLIIMFQSIEDSIVNNATLLIIIGSLIVVILSFYLDYLPNFFSHHKIVRGFLSLSSESRSCLFSYKYGLSTLLLSILGHSISIIVVINISAALALNVTWLDIVMIVPITTLFMVIPITIAGWGVREGIMVTGLSYVGVVPEEALPLALIYGFTALLVALPGGVLWLFSFRNISLKSNKITK